MRYTIEQITEQALRRASVPNIERRIMYEIVYRYVVSCGVLLCLGDGERGLGE